MMHAVYCNYTLYFDHKLKLLSQNLAASRVEDFDGDLKLK